MKKIWLMACLLWCLGLLAANPCVYAENSWKVDRIGSFTVPEEWQAVDMMQVLDTIMKEVPARNAKPPGAVLPPRANPFTLAQAVNLKIYQITLHDEAAYRTAFLAIMKSSKPMTPAEANLFSHEMTAEEKAQLENKIRSSYQQFTDNLTSLTKIPSFSMTCLGLAPLEYLTVNGKPAYGEGIRVLVSTYGVIIPYYAKGYLFDSNGFMTVAAVFTADSERLYWDPIIGNVISSFEPASIDGTTVLENPAGAKL